MPQSRVALPFARPFYVMAKPAGARCNLACRYCYYLDKAGLYPDSRRPVMSEALLERFVSQYIGAQTQPEVLFTWHGGEPLLLPVDFYRRALQLQRQYGRGRHIDNCLQTNGTLLDDEWCRFFRQNNFLVGVSIDGPRPMHEAYRGHSFDRVMRGIGLLQRHGVEWNAMATVHKANVHRAAEFYHFFRNLGCRYLQFTPIVERTADGRLTPESVTADEWGEFLCTLFDEWAEADVGQLFVQLFDATMANWCGLPSPVCSMAPECGQSTAMEWNGDVFSCDHFVSTAHRLGNICRQTLAEMAYSERQRRFGREKRTLLPRQCRECRWLFACNGECPKNRFATDAYGQPGLNHLCKGYRRFFEHSAPLMTELRQQIGILKAGEYNKTNNSAL